MTRKTEPLTLHSLKNPWADNDNNIWLASSVRLHRNLDKILFPAKLSVEKRQEVVSIIRDGLAASETPDLTLIRSEDLTPMDREFLSEHFLGIESFQQAHAGEAFLLDRTGQFVAVVNVKDHLHLLITECHEDTEDAWERIVDLETGIGSSVNYAFSSRFGFLTSDFMQSGTGLLVNVYLHVPGIIHSGQLADILDKQAGDEITATGIQGGLTELTGDVLTVRNTCTLGVTEETILSSVKICATKLLVTERGIRTALKNGEGTEMKNRVARAFGLLRHSYHLDTLESLSALSLLKLGIDVGWVEGTEHRPLNQLFFNCQRAHLMALHKNKLEPEELPRKRAELIHQHLRSAALTI